MLGAEVVVVDPRKVRVIAETKHKTDRTDARILADLLRTGALPKALWRVPKATRQLRDKVRLRWGLVQQRAGLYLRARSLLSSIGINLGKRALVNDLHSAHLVGIIPGNPLTAIQVGGRPAEARQGARRLRSAGPSSRGQRPERHAPRAAGSASARG